MLRRSSFIPKASVALATATASSSSLASSLRFIGNSSTTANNAGVAVQDFTPTNSDGKIVVFGGDAREMMLGGIERIAKAVSVTLGPKGRNVVIRLPNGEPKITKDGVTVARSITFRNQFEDVGARLVRQVASKTNDVAGDGTTTATVLAWSIFGEGYKAVATGANPMDLKRGIDSAVTVVLESLAKQTRKINGLDELISVATISANGEKRLGEMIAKAVQSVGVTGFISVLDGRTPETEWQRHGGWSSESGFIDSQLVTDDAHLITEFTGKDAETLVFCTNAALTTADDVLPILDAAAQAKKPLVIAANQISGEALETVILNHTKGSQKTCVVVPRVNPSVSNSSNNYLADLAASCGCNVIDRESYNRYLSAGSSVSTLLGKAVSVEQNMDSTVIVGSSDAGPRIRYLEKKLERTTEEPERDDLRERIAKLTKTFAVIRVGGQTAVEIMESKDRVIDALNASRAALTDGIVAGGGAALLHASKELDKLLVEDEEMEQDHRTGIFIVRNAIRLPMRTIGNNAGVEGAVVVQSVVEEEDTGMGYDAQNNIYVNMFEAGIVDPVRVVKCCIVDAASVAGLKITTEAIVCEDTGDVAQPLMSETINLLSGHGHLG